MNIVGLKQLFIVRNLFKEAKRIIKHNDDKTFVIIPYMVYHHVRVAYLLKKQFGNRVIICQTIPDIFHYDSKFSPGFWMNRYAEKKAAKSDAFILFTRQMADYLHIANDRHIVMESVIDGEAYKGQNKEKINDNDKIHVLYTGSLSNEHGVMKLVEMMRLMSRDDFELWITGRGALMDNLTKAAEEDNRIRFFGTVAKEEVFRLQSIADILINPRSDGDSPELTQYLFPSKVMEYMLTGNPAMICRMSGIPEEYYNYVYLVENSTPEGIAGCLNEVLNKSPEERFQKGQSARKFILDNKTIFVQTRRIVEFLKCF